jgi:ribose transport system ATP-binding protein
MTESAPPLELIGLSKSFGSFTALDGVNLTVQRGEVHGLVGQNGSGKSTLVKLLSGYHTPDRGSVIKIDGVVLRPQAQLRHLREAGIAIVHQDLGLVADKTVAENIAVGDFRPGRWTRKVNWRAEEATAVQVLTRLESAIDPRRLVGSLDPADRAMVAIARALRAQKPGRGLIVLDESTRALPRHALEDFYRALRSVVAAGGSALMISHNLEEVMQVSDRITVLRDGRMVGDSVETAYTSEREIARMMLGRNVDRGFHTRTPAVTTQEPITVSGLTGEHLTDVDLQISPGEVVGITGVAGAGWDELPYLLGGARRASGGLVYIDGRTVALSKATPAGCIAAGIAFLPEHRITDGLALPLTVRENITLPRVATTGRPWRIGSKWERMETASVIASLEVRPPRDDLPVGKLSGGNQQKVMLGKWLQGQPRLLILHEPTQAVDIGAREDILRAVADTAGRGIAVIVASIQPADLAAVCNRVVVVRDGRISHDLRNPTDDGIVEAVYAGHLDFAAEKD